MSKTLILDRSYSSSFTPKGKPEHAKTCPECKKLLSATRFKGAKGTRNSIQGIIRNEKCRNCESARTIERKHERTSRAEVAIDDLSHKIVEIQCENEILRKKIEEHAKWYEAMEKIIDTVAEKLNLDFDENGDLIKVQISRFSQKKEASKECL